MKRDALKQLRSWRTDPIRTPLLLRGARQVGKSWLVDHFGNEFDHYIAINFEKDKRVHTLFPEHIDIADLLLKLKAYTAKPIIAGKTLIFLDEIQEHPIALTYLRYFKEEYPQYHIIAAGSLLEFTLEKIGMAVGRVDYLYLYPLSFMEFLTALQRDDLRQYILDRNVDPATHQVLIEHLRNYMWLGGMPTVIDAWIQYQDHKICQRLHDRIIQNYQDDFQKYAKSHQIEMVAKVFQAIPQQLGQKFKYSNVDPGTKIYPVKQALSLLKKAGIVYECFHTSAQNYPLGTELDEKKFKAFIFDIGIAQRMLGLDLSEWFTQPMQINYLGFAAEQLAAQEFIAYSVNNKAAQLYYWHNETKTGNAEVDFITVYNKQIVPVEIKSRVKGGMKSLRVFLDSHPHVATALKISESMFATHGNLIEFPLYGIAAWFDTTNR